MNKKTIYINLYGGPASGKSTTAARLFGELKLRGADCELVTEYAKDKVWEGTTNVFNDQFYVSAKQWHRLFSLKGKVDYVITDSPILMSAVYANKDDNALKVLIVDRHESIGSINIFINRDPDKFSQNGRSQNLEESKQKDQEIKDWVNFVCQFDLSIDRDHDTSTLIGLIDHIVAGRAKEDKKKKVVFEDLTQDILKALAEEAEKDEFCANIDSKFPWWKFDSVGSLTDGIKETEEIKKGAKALGKFFEDNKKSINEINESFMRGIKEGRKITLPIKGLKTSCEKARKYGESVKKAFGNEAIQKSREFQEKFSKECLHETCGSCDGTGKNKHTGLECYHFLVCPCPKCQKTTL